MREAKRRILPQSGNGILRPILENQAGSVLPLVAAGTMVLAALAGGGLDIARGYKAERRLQSACDAGVLAGRRAVSEAGLDAAAKTQAQNYFNANFDAVEQSMSGVVFTPESPDDGDTVNGTASGKLKTMIVAVFGFKEINLSVSCSASMGVGNADIMFVLDNTASMEWKPESNSYPSGTETSRMTALRSAMKGFYDTVAKSVSGGNARIRYGFVPYANTVNVGKILYAKDANYLANSITVPSLALVNWTTNPTKTWTDPTPQAGSTTNGSWSKHSSTNYGSSSSCKNSSGVSQVPSPNPTAWVDGALTYDATTTEVQTSNGKQLKTTGTHQAQSQTEYQCRDDPGVSGTQYYVYKRTNTRDMKGTNYEERDQVAVTATNTTFANAILQDRTFDTSNYKKMSSTTIPVGISSGTKTNYTQTTTWNGCIQERQTTPAPTFSFVSLLTGIQASNSQTALDLDIDAAPTTGDPNSQWRTQWWQVTFGRDNIGTAYTAYENLDDDRNGSISTGSNSEYDENVSSFERTTNFTSLPASYCPYESQLLEEMTEADFDKDVDAMDTVSYGTYHDSGLLWGARLSSPTGIFASNVNEDAGNGGTVSRHVIFMTDGDMEPMAEVNGLYGNETLVRRISGTAVTTALDMTALEARHVSRGKAICQAIKARGIRLWVIALGTSLTADMTACASPDSAMEAKSSAKLTEKFQEIAKQVGELRVTQ